MSLLYNSNINSVLEIKSNVDLITERIANNSGFLQNYEPSSEVIEDFRIFYATRNQEVDDAARNSKINDLNSETYELDFYKVITNNKFNKVLSNTFQNIKSQGLDCFSFIKNINGLFNTFISETYTSKQISHLNYVMGMPVDNFFVSFYKSNNNFNKISPDNRFYLQKTAKNHAAYSFIKANHSSLQKYSVYGLDALLFDADGKQNYINVNENSSNVNPHMTATMINSPYIRGSLQNELEMHTFLNSYNSLEFSKCIPYLDVKMKMARYEEEYESQYRSNANIKSFLYPDDLSSRDSLITNEFSSRMRKENSTIHLEEIHIGTFTMPQTAVNLNTKNYGRSENAKSPYTITPIVPHDLTRPFMSIKKLDLDVQTAGGLISHKSGTLSLTLHDRARMRQVAAFLDASLQGAYGPRITIEFGWSHPSEKGNKLGEFLNSAKTKDTYSITNSNFTMESDGSVNIDMFIAQISGRIFTSIKFATDPEIVNNIKKTNAIIKQLIGLIGIDVDKIGTTENLNMFKFEYSNFNEKSYEKLRSLFKKISNRLDEISTNSNPDATNKLVELLIGYTPDPENTVSIDFASFNKKYTELVNHVDLVYKAKKSETTVQASKLFKKICPNIDNFDPFWDRILWQYLSKDTKLSSSIGNREDYMTFGSLISGLIATHLPGEHQFSDIQLYSYTCNDSCGYMSNRNIFSILVEKKKVIEKIVKIYDSRADITLERFITDIYVELVKTERNVSWGISNAYENLDNPQNEVKGKQNKDFKKKVDIRLFEIKKALGREIINSKIELRIPELSFVFNSSENKEKNKLIYKMSFYDKHDNILRSMLDISNSLKTKKLKSAIVLQQFENSSIKKINKYAAGIAIKGLRSVGVTDSDKIIYDFMNEAVKKELKDQQKRFKNALFTEESLGEDSTKLVLKSQYNYDNVIENIKYNLPSITYGTENTAVLSASLSSMSQSGLTEVKIAEMARRRDRLYTEERILSNLPLKIFPTAATVEIIGCPFVNFNQDLFLDFQTGTIADNVYKITGIKHILTPGSFKTSLTLTPNDAYGAYETHIKGIESLLNSDFSNIDIEKEIKLDEEDKKIKAKKEASDKGKTTAAKVKNKQEQADIPLSATTSQAQTPATTSQAQTPATTSQAQTPATTTVSSSIRKTKGENCLATTVKRYLKVRAADPKLRGRSPLGSVKRANFVWNNYKSIVDAAAEEYNIEASLIWSVMAGESSFKLRAVSQAGAAGLMQFMVGTAEGFGMTPEDRFDPSKAIPAAAKYFRQIFDNAEIKRLTKKNMGLDGVQVESVLAGYNAGPDKVIRALKGFNNYKQEYKGDKNIPRTGKNKYRLYALDDQIPKYIHPILTFKRLLDECFAEKEKQLEEESSTVPAPLRPQEDNDDDDPRINSTRNQKVTPKSKIVSSSTKAKGETIKNVYLFSSVHDFKALTVLAFLTEIVKQEEIDKKIKASDYFNKDTFNYNYYIEELHSYELIDDNVYFAIKDHIEQVDDLYQYYVDYFNGDLNLNYNYAGKNLISTFIPIPYSNLTDEEKNIFFSSSIFFSEDDKNFSKDLNKYSEDFFIRENKRNKKLFEEAIAEEDKRKISVIMSTLLSRFVLWNFTRLQYKSEDYYKDTSIFITKKNFFDNMKTIKSYRASLFNEVANRREYTEIRRFLDLRHNKNNPPHISHIKDKLETTIFIKKIVVHEVISNEYKIFKEDTLDTINRLLEYDLNEYNTFVTANIIIPDKKFTGYSEKKQKRYFSGKGLLLDLNIVSIEGAMTQNRDFNINLMPDVFTSKPKAYEEDDSVYSETVLNITKYLKERFYHSDSNVIISLFKRSDDNKLYVYLGANKGKVNHFENMVSNDVDKNFNAVIDYFKNKVPTRSR